MPVNDISSTEIIRARINIRGIHVLPKSTYCSVPTPPYDNNRSHSCNIVTVLQRNRLFLRKLFILLDFAKIALRNCDGPKEILDWLYARSNWNWFKNPFRIEFKAKQPFIIHYICYSNYGYYSQTFIVRSGRIVSNDRTIVFQ